MPGFHGVLAYTLREALWQVAEGVTDDAVLGYPTVDRGGIDRLLGDERALAAVTLMVDDPAHLDLVDAVRAGRDATVRVAIDIDAGLRLGTSHVGPKRSPLYDEAQVVDLARRIAGRPGFALVGVMTYEGQVAGVPDDVPGQRAKSLIVRRLKSASINQLVERRGRIAAALREVADLEFWNAGGSGSVESTVADPAVTEVAAGSGLLVPGLFDHYESFEPRPAAYFGLRVARRPSGIARDRRRWRLRRQRAGGQGPAAGSLGSPRPAPDRARGCGRGADAADRSRCGDAGDRRPGLVPARQGRRAGRAHEPRAPAQR